MECFPLAVALAAERACGDKTATPAMYLDALRRAGSKRAKGRGATGEYPECFPDVVKLLLDTLLQSDQAHVENAEQALRKLALLDTEAIPLDLLGADERKAVLLLQEHSLVTVDDTGCAAMHAVTQQVMRDWLISKAQRPVLVATLAAVLASKLGKFHSDKPATYFIGRRYARHAGAVAARAREWGVLPVSRLAGGVDGSALNNIEDMCQRAGHFFEFVSVQPREALRMHEVALDSSVIRFGARHVIVAMCHSNIGNVYRSQGNFDEALVEHQKSLKIKIRALGCKHQEVATSYNNIGNVYAGQGNYQKALLQYQKSLEIYIRVLGCDSAEVAMSYMNIGEVCRLQGDDHQNALHQLQKSLEIRIRLYGEDHPRVADSKYGMGRVYEDCNEMDLACELFLECQRIYSKLYGPGHSKTVMAAEAAQEASRCGKESV